MACHRLNKKLIILGRGETKMATGGGEKGDIIIWDPDAIWFFFSFIINHLKVHNFNTVLVKVIEK